MQPIFHVGYPKTATSWLQKNFFPYIKNGDYIPRRITFETFVQPSTYAFNPDEIRLKFPDSKHDYLIFSLEGFIGTNHNFGLNGYMTSEHAKRMHQVYPDAMIILFIRNQYDIISSTYLQYIKGGGTYNIKKFIYHKHLKNIAALTLFNWEYFEYHKVIRMYQKLFGKDNVHIFVYEDFASDTLHFVREMSQSFNFQVDLDNINYSRVNPSSRQLARIFALLANLFTERKMINKYYLVHIPGWFEFSRRIINKMNQNKLFGKRLQSGNILTKRIITDIGNHYRESNNILIDEIKLTQIRNYNYPL